jgi:arylformamidase
VSGADARRPDALASLASAIRALRIHDATARIDADLPVFPTYEPPRVVAVHEHGTGDFAANTLELPEHAGTHVDAPFHFDPHGKTVDLLPADVLLLRPFKKFDLSANDHQPGDLVGPEHLAQAAARAGFALEEGDVAVLELGWDRHLPGGASGREPGWWARNQPGLSDDACRYLAEAAVCAVASDTGACDVACIDGTVLSGPGHTEYFLPQGILIVEGLRGLASVPATGLFLALPLKIAGGTGSPVRVLLLSA